MRLRPLHRREDGSVVVELPNGWPYHVLPDDPLWEEARALDWSQAIPEPPPPEPVKLMDPPPALAPAISEDRLRAVLRALGHSDDAISRALEATVDEAAEK